MIRMLLFWTWTSGDAPVVTEYRRIITHNVAIRLGDPKG
jgi:hypothetical protein